VLTTAVGLMAVKELNLKEPLYQTKPRGYLCSHAKSFEEVRLAAAALESLRARCEQADRWITDIKAKRNPDGTYGKGRGAARYTAGAVVTLLRLGAAVDHPDKVLKVLQDGQRPDGAWGTAEEEGSDLETTYRVMRAFVMLKAKPHDVRACQRFLSRCRQDNGSYAVRPGQTGNMASTYFAGIVLHWLDNAR
jgi:prenyltransferase beta subunit